MFKNILGYGSILAIVIYLNIRAWDMTHGESFVDSVNWGGAAVILIIGGILIWIDKKKEG